MEQLQICIQALDTCERSTEDNRAIWGEIYMESNGYFFPSKHWHDAVSSILDIWLFSICEFISKNESQCDLYFMDGPFTIRLNRFTESLLHVSLMERPYITHKQLSLSLRKFVDQILIVTDFFIEACNVHAADFCKTNIFQRIVNRFNALQHYSNRIGDG